ncbi:unnamed protein product, partial [marine sediment metagenome]
ENEIRNRWKKMVKLSLGYLEHRYNLFHFGSIKNSFFQLRGAQRDGAKAKSPKLGVAIKLQGKFP